MKKSELERQLRKTGANTSESQQLADLAADLSTIKTKGLSDKTRQQIMSNIDRKPRIVYPLRWAMGGVAMVFVAAAIAVLALPNRPAQETMQSADDHTTQLLDQEDLTDKQTEIEQLMQQQAPLEQIEEAEKQYENAVDQNWQRYRSQDDKSQDEYWNWRNNNNYRDYRDGYVNSWFDRRDEDSGDSRRRR